MQDAKHNQAVALLTGTEADVHLKVYREHLIIKNVSQVVSALWVELA